MVASFDASLYFHTWAWLDFQERVLGVLFERFVVEHEGHLVGVVPLSRFSRHSLTSPALPYPFQGPLVPSELVDLFPGALRRRQVRSGLLVERYDVGPLLADDWGAVLKTRPSEVRDRRTVVIDLQGHDSADSLLSSYSRSHRRSVNRAERAGAVVRRPEPGEVSAVLPALLEEAYTSHGETCPYPSAIGPLTEEWMQGRSDVTVLVAEVEDGVAGMLVALGGRPTAVAWVGGCFRRFRHLSVNVLLYHHMLCWAMEHGHARIDLLAGVEEDGPLRYKLSFGGRPCYGFNVESTAVPHRALEVARRLSGAHD